MKVNIIADVDIAPLEKILMKDGRLIPVPYSILQQFPQETITAFCVKKGIYQVPTTELIEFLSSEIPVKEKTIEIGAGNGCIGRTLGIRMIDNKMQEWPVIKAYYESIQQPVVDYGPDVETLTAEDAIKKYRPSTVIGCWITQKWAEGVKHGNMYGVDEKKMLRSGVKKYIHVGNEESHGDKNIRVKKHRVIKEEWLVSRSLNKQANVIYIFEKE